MSYIAHPFFMFNAFKSEKMIKNETSCIRFSDRKFVHIVVQITL